MSTTLTFEQFNFDPEITKALLACGYTSPTPVQVKSIPVILEGRDLVASAQTGTGKTAAFVLPALHHLSQAKPNSAKPRVLILTPTRELSTQITTAIEKYSKFSPTKIVSLVGGMPYFKQLKDLARPVDIIVATPGRLLDHLARRRVDLSEIDMLILDEADRMLDMGFVDDVREISRLTPESRQTLLFSATVDNKLARIIGQLLKNPVRVDLSHENLAPTQIQQEIYVTDSAQHKLRILQHFLENESMFKAIIFSATKVNADDLADELCDQGYAAAPLHGDLKQNVRNRTIEQFRRGNIQYLIATDVAARGIHIDDITHVINYDLPKFSEDYVHRIGRTGRAGKKGKAISFVSHIDIRHLGRIERYVGQKLERMTIPGLEPTRAIPSTSDRPAPSKKKRFGDRSFSDSNSRKRFSSDRPSSSNSNRYASERGPMERSENRTGDRRPVNGNTMSDRRPAENNTFERAKRPQQRDGAAPRPANTFSDRPKRADSFKARDGKKFEGPRGANFAGKRRTPSKQGNS